MPKRIQRQRAKGWHLPPNTVYVGRPTKWGNPFARGGVRMLGITAGPQTQSDVVAMFRRWLIGNLSAFSTRETWNLRLNELRGKDLACWCPLDEPCHADVLLEWANR